MGWLLVIFSLIVLWIASLCKALRAPSKGSFLDDRHIFIKRNVLLVIAHPDDESMFFSPTINYLIARRHNLHILCLSVGNADGMGNLRKNELYQACAVLKVQLEKVRTLDHQELQDGFGKFWNHSLVAKIIEEEISGAGIDLIITFDHYGVSRHCNHRDVHYGVCKYFHDTSRRDIEAWELVSTNLFRKYIGPIDIWLSNFDAKRNPGRLTHCIVNEHPKKSFHAMAQHSSQWVWFRKLFVSLFSYTYVNTLRKINK
ncbi:probable N-acetylglucosaminyl-phosphatidylinositol de-N-acetylase isoform X1 [Tripterygium wilfordii]|uniref:probable N-acetylglucosaminyl-phosphatidylinositol de-N-acetylase isoform X1 n=1 Tax=Tripterygium wilfordii TaxID=458696 RepID=UPI0018F85843|nr:probable N-acetylglucosaminyl-phosphatidylinositol de-N-acetylase isoform X1 [Tripterygium wilfordii]XP_038687085.1 probable N-acetylglucosaminyl-phosphatidylinositol de-N-acetylase isoform X1 [Tripterygium wilfordii]